MAIYGDWSDGAFSFDPDTGVLLLYTQADLDAGNLTGPMRLNAPRAPGYPLAPTANEALTVSASGDGYSASFDLFGDAGDASIEGVLTDSDGRTERLSGYSTAAGEPIIDIKHYLAVSSDGGTWAALGVLIAIPIAFIGLVLAINK